MTDLSEKTELGLLPRLIAAGWFAVAACIPVFFFMVIFGQTAIFMGGFLFFFGVVPISLAAFFGFAVGVKILDPVRSTSKLWAAARGVIVALLSHLVFMTLFLVQVEISERAPEFGFAFAIVSFGFTIPFLPVAFVGGLAGWWLCDLSCRGDLWKWLLNLPRVSTTTASIWILAAALSVLLTSVAGIYLFRSVRY
jgi:hypothetical protein